MSRGLGDTMRAALTVLADKLDEADALQDATVEDAADLDMSPEQLHAAKLAQVSLTTTELADRLGISTPQARRLIRALEARGLVGVEMSSSGQKGEGEYGPIFNVLIEDESGYRVVPGGHIGMPIPVLRVVLSDWVDSSLMEMPTLPGSPGGVDADEIRALLDAPR